MSGTTGPIDAPPRAGSSGAGAHPPAQRRRTTGAGRDAAALAALVLVWAVAVAGCLALAHWTKIGPVVLQLSHRHGVHSGDLVAGAGCALLASIASAVLVRWWRDPR